MTSHIIVDGSNIATEGRSAPSLAQLHEAVTAFIEENPRVKVTVVVDATFGHRIAKKEVAEFNKAIEHNELVAPPAGAIGRGDAFILAIADKARATVLSNDSFQEFHGKYAWLFDEGRLIGGKPVPHVGWVFVARVPARGETSRKAMKTGKVVTKDRTASPEASKPMPVPSAPPPGAREKMVNAVLPYLSFVEGHPVGSTVTCTVSGYAANGMTVTIGDVNGYVPIRNISSPPPRTVRGIYEVGTELPLVIVGYTATRRSVDLAVPGVVEVKAPEPSKGTTRRKSAASAAPARKASPVKAPAPAVKKPAPVKKAVAEKKPAPAAKKATAPKKAAPATNRPAPAKKAAPAVKKPAPAKKAAPAVKKPAPEGKAAPAARKAAATKKS